MEEKEAEDGEERQEMEWRRCRSVWKMMKIKGGENEIERKKGGEETKDKRKKAGKTTEAERAWETNRAKLPESTVEREDRADRDQVILRTEKCHVSHIM